MKMARNQRLEISNKSNIENLKINKIIDLLIQNTF
jgi:hypothetical protein